MLRNLRRGWSRLAATPGLGAARLCMLAALDTTLGGTPRPTEWCLLCGWKTPDARDEFVTDGSMLLPMLEGAHEYWNLSLDTVRAVRGDWWGWRPDTSGVARFDEHDPLLVMTYAHLRPRYVPSFTWRNRQIVRDVADHPGLVTRIGFFDTPEARGTLTLWRSQREMVDFAYRTQPHDPVQREALRVPWGENFFFARFRPVAAGGTWGGDDPLARSS